MLDCAGPCPTMPGFDKAFARVFIAEQLADKDETIDGFEFRNETLSTSLESLKNQLAVAENALIEEKAKNKMPSTGRPQTSPLRDATNA